MSSPPPSLPRRLLAEALGTAALVGVGTGAVVWDTALDGRLGPAGVSLSFGLVVAAVILTVGPTSGAHINPAVTVALAASARFPWRDVGPYVAAQSVGAVLGSLVVWAADPSHPSLGATVPTVSAGAGLAIEVAITAALMVSIFSITSGRVRAPLHVALTVGGAVAVLAFLAGAATGASMNPARSLGPAVVLGDLSWLWLYTLAPVLGALAAVSLCRPMLRLDAAARDEPGRRSDDPVGRRRADGPAPDASAR